MKYNQIPAKFPIPWGFNAGGGFINPIPTPSQTAINPGRASLTDGFPPLNFQPVGAGGVPPFGQDMNGILNQITMWNRWQAAGGQARFDAAFAAAIGGYPMSAMLAGSTSGTVWLNTVDDNVTDPEGVSPAGWINLATQSASISVGTDTGGANVLTANVSPAPTAYLNGAIFIVQKIGTANNGAMVGNIQSLGQRPIVGPNGAPLTPGQYPASHNGILIYLTALSSLLLLNPASAADPSTVQPGTIEFYTGVVPPTGRIKANGASLSRTTYAALWSFAQVSGNLAGSQGLKTVGQFGPGDGSTTFTIPDLRGYFLRAFDDAAGIDPGRAFGSTQGDAFASHIHFSWDQSGGNVWNTNVSNITVGPTVPGRLLGAGVAGVANGPSMTTTATGGTETRPKNVSLLACIKI
ncbi:phage tail protein [Labrys sp. KB_33_2]|uniref:phage tail protein n=1 Tax=Labrys sp. KB_33_2 TaxID=3237479 RepID=UPI003F9282DA